MSDKELKIENYNEQLKQLCAICRKVDKCDHEKICALKKLAWIRAKQKLHKSLS